ncbi:hypothetical protein GX865_00145 [Candidatus Saccharibacteria bacterium]|nr:hypothetical protein [Candidatus Saccharibacteria bacterium]
MSLRMKIAIGAVAAVLGLFYVSALSKNEGDSQNRTELISSTSKTTNTEATETADRTDIKPEDMSAKSEGNKDTEQSSQTSAKLIDFKLEDFKKTAGTRVLVFHNPANASSKKTHLFIKDNLKSFSKKVTFFTIDYTKNKELVDHYNVQQPGTLIAFTKDGEISGIYASENPNLEAAKSALGV